VYVKLHIIIRPKQGFSVAKCDLAFGNCYWRFSLIRKHIGRTEVLLHIFLTSTLNGGEWLISRTLRFTCGKESQYITKLIVYIRNSVNAPDMRKSALGLGWSEKRFVVSSNVGLYW